MLMSPSPAYARLGFAQTIPMKSQTLSIQSIVSLCLISLFLCVSSVGCKPETPSLVEPDSQKEPAAPSTGCRITSLTRTIASWSPPGISKATWTYDSNNRLLEYDNPTSVGPDPAHISNTYDASGYLISARKAYVYSGIAGFVYDTTTTTFGYKEDRLVREVTNGRVISYNYDQSGNLTSIVDNGGPYGDTVTDTFSAGKLTDHSILYYGSAAKDHPYTIANGLVLRAYARDRTYYTGYTYDEQGRQTKIEEFDNGRVRQYYTLTYLDGNPYYKAQPLPKGWPEILRKKLTVNESQVGLPTEYVRYKPSLSGSSALLKNMVTHYVYTHNGQGYPLRCEYTTTVYSPQGNTVGTPSRVIETFTYEGCN